jgi:hypothetical protein
MFQTSNVFIIDAFQSKQSIFVMTNTKLPKDLSITALINIPVSSWSISGHLFASMKLDSGDLQPTK